MLYFLNDDSITVIFDDNEIASWNNKDSNYYSIVELVKVASQPGNEKYWEPIKTLHNYTKAILTSNKVKVENDTVVVGVNEGKISIPITEQDSFLMLIKTLKDNGVIESEIDKVKPFLINCIDNIYIDAVHEIYQYCKAMDFEITEDGCFLAYKRVDKNYGSIHDNGATKHAIGEYTEVKNFDTNRKNHCSSGLHFCSRSYLRSYSGDKVIIVKINPKDVVSIPTDYNFAKGRCRRYMMVGELAADGTLKTTNIEAATKEKVVKSKVAKKEDKKLAEKEAKSGNRIQETVQNMKIYKNDIQKVSKIMNISPETVKRNLRKAKTRK